MKKLCSAYSFDHVAGTIWSPDFQRPDSVLMVVNLNETDPTKRILFNFADVTKSGTVNNTTNILTLDTDTSGILNAVLQIFVDDGLTPPSAELDTQLTDLLREGIGEIVRQLQAIRNDGGMADVSGRVRVAIETPSTFPVSITSNQDIRNITGALANITSIGGYQTTLNNLEMTNAGAQNLRSRISIT